MVTAGLFITLCSLVAAAVATLAAIYLGCWCVWYTVTNITNPTKNKR